jgi:chaperonin GroEL
MGPRGRNIVLGQLIGPPVVTQDGLTVAKAIKLPDAAEDMGARFCREIAERTNADCGDGTSSTIVLARAILRGGLTLIEAGADPLRLKRGIQTAVRAVGDYIRGQSKAAAPRHLLQVASGAAKSADLGALIAEAFQAASGGGFVSVEEAIERRSFVRGAAGLSIPSGYISPYFLDDRHGAEIELIAPYILMTDRVISTLQPLRRVLAQCVWEKRPLLILAPHVRSEALEDMLRLRSEGGGKIVAVRTPGDPEQSLEVLEDLAAAAGGVALIAMLGRELDEAAPAHLGQAERIAVTRDRTVVSGGKGRTETKNSQVRRLRALLEQTREEKARARLQDRIAALSGGVTVVCVGGDTKTELQERKARAIDAVQAAKAAAEGGVVPGGGTALLRAGAALERLTAASPDEQAGIRLAGQSLSAPLRRIVQNAGGSGDRVMAELGEREFAIGYDAVSRRYVNMWEAGVIDPAKVVTTALDSAASLSALLLTAEVLLEKYQGETTLLELSGSH